MKIFLLTFLFFLNAKGAFATKIVGNGGDAQAIEFTMIAEAALAHLRSESPGFDVNALEEALNNTEVESVNKTLLLNGAVKEAINYPQLRRIVFNRKIWKGLSQDRKNVLVLHEYLGILTVDDTGYKISRGALRNFHYRELGSIAEDIGALSVTKVFPEILDKLEQGLAVIRATETVDRSRTRNNRVVIIGLPDLSDFLPHRVDTLLDEIQSIELDGAFLMIRGAQYNYDTDSSDSAILRVKIKEKPGSMEYLDRVQIRR